MMNPFKSRLERLEAARAPELPHSLIDIIRAADDDATPEARATAEARVRLWPRGCPCSTCTMIREAVREDPRCGT